ncbi:MAG: hypothetical protein Q9N34_05715 [Aquificota bacterium]|nr:hypothetical protein [Aquificota bacterium]
MKDMKGMKNTNVMGAVMPAAVTPEEEIRAAVIPEAGNYDCKLQC